MYLERINWAEMTFEVTRSRGPGGQNVNKTNSAVILRWSPLQSAAFNELEKAILQQKLGSKLTVDGDLLIRSEDSRDQDQNRKSCLEKLERILAGAFFVQKKRKATKPTKSSKRKRVDTKRHRGDIKSGRGKAQWDD
jgi:ribosome-associated protein